LGHSYLIHLIFKSQIIRNHGDKLAIRGLSSVILNGVSKVRIEGIHVAPIPSDLNCVSDCSLDTARGGPVFLCHGGIQDFCDTVDDVAVIYREHYRSSEILVALFE